MFATAGRLWPDRCATVIASRGNDTAAIHPGNAAGPPLLPAETERGSPTPVVAEILWCGAASSSVEIEGAVSSADDAMLVELLSPRRMRRPLSLEQPLLHDMPDAASPKEQRSGHASASMWDNAQERNGDANPLSDAQQALPSEQSVLPSNNSSVSSILSTYRRTWIRLSLFSYNVVTTVTVAYFNRRSVGEGQSRLRLYPTIDPASSQYTTLMPLMAILLMSVVSCVPLLMLYLWVQRRKHWRDVEGGWRQSGPPHSLFVMLTCSFQERYWLMGAVVLPDVCC